MPTAVISTTHDDKYLWYLPLTTWVWNKLGVDVVCFMPIERNGQDYSKVKLAMEFCNNHKLSVYQFFAPEHKEATYSQCSRLYGACLDLPQDEVLITSDIDMLVFKQPPYFSGFTIFGADLVPPNQYPMCYISAKVSDWRSAFNLHGKGYQECLDELMKDRDSISMRSDFWSLDQEIGYNNINTYKDIHLLPRTNGQNQFSTNRLDRDDFYILDRLNNEIIDYHANRPPYEDSNFEKILTILKFFYPEENFEWLVEYQNSYVNLIQK